MPFKSLAQSKLFFAKAKEKGSGISPEKTKEWATKTDYKTLPEKIKK